MPALLTTVQEFQSTSLGSRLAPYYSDLDNGDVDRTLMQVCDEANRITGRLLGQPPATAFTDTASPGAQIVTLNTVANIEPGDVLVVPSTGETVEIMGAEVIMPAIPDDTGLLYPGSVMLNDTITGTYAAATPVQIYRQERYEIRGRSTSGLDSTFPETQAGQVARMHAPMLGRGGSSRIIMLRQYPVWSLHAAYQSLVWGSDESLVDLSSVYLKRETGSYRLPVGFFNPLASIWRTQYLAGFPAGFVPYDIRKAVHLLLAAELVSRTQNAMGATTYKVDDESFTNPGAQYRADAACALAPYTRSWA